MFIPTIAKLTKDLPDIAAGALFTSISKEHYNELYSDDKYDNDELFYFHQGLYNMSPLEGDISRYHWKNLKNWCEFFDYSDFTFKQWDQVKIFDHKDI